MKKVIAPLLVAVILIFSNTMIYAQTCVLSCPSNMVVKAEDGKEGALISFPESNTLGLGNCGTITYSRPSGSFFRLGSHSIIATTSQGQKCFFSITVTDNEPPILSELTLSTTKLSPTNKMKKVAVYYTASDNGQEVTSVLSVKSNDTEANNRDWQVVNNHMLRLKTTPLPSGEPRVYTITVSSTDASGNTTRRTTRIASKIPAVFATNDPASPAQPLQE